jgi:uncharacterized protein YxjI
MSHHEEPTAMSAPDSSPAAGYVLELRQKFTVLQNRYDLVRVERGAALPLAYAEQKRFSLKEKVTFWSGNDRREVAFTIAARNIIELVGTYDVRGPADELLATIRKDAKTSLLRSTYRIELPGGAVVTGQERGQLKAVLRRVVGLASDLPWPFPIHFDFLGTDGRPVLAVERQMRLRDVYHVPVTDGRLDWRVAAAVAVAVDAFMNR